MRNEKPVHDAPSGAAMRFVGGEKLGECTEAARRVNRGSHAVAVGRKRRRRLRGPWSIEDRPVRRF